MPLIHNEPDSQSYDFQHTDSITFWMICTVSINMYYKNENFISYWYRHLKKCFLMSLWGENENNKPFNEDL